MSEITCSLFTQRHSFVALVVNRFSIFVGLCSSSIHRPAAERTKEWSTVHTTIVTSISGLETSANIRQQAFTPKTAARGFECNGDVATAIITTPLESWADPQMCSWIVGNDKLHRFYSAAFIDSLRRQIDSPGAPIASTARVAGSRVGATRDEVGCSTVLWN